MTIVSFHEEQLLYLLPVVANMRSRSNLDLFNPTLSVWLENNKQVQKKYLLKVKDKMYGIEGVGAQHSKVDKLLQWTVLWKKTSVTYKLELID